MAPGSSCSDYINASYVDVSTHFRRQIFLFLKTWSQLRLFQNVETLLMCCPIFENVLPAPLSPSLRVISTGTSTS